MQLKQVKCSYCGDTLTRRKTKTNRYYCNLSCKGKWQTKQREDLGYTKEWLYTEYHKNKKSANQIAREIKRDPKRVWEWIKDYGIETRPRGTDYGYGFKTGDVSPFKGKHHSAETKEKIRQISIKDGRVPYLKDGEHWLKQEGARPASWNGGCSPDRQVVYSSEEWVSAVKKVWERDNAICQRCGKHHNTAKARGTFHIHHIISFMVKKQRVNPDNLILLCKSCHKWVHSKKNIKKQFIKEL